MDDYFLVGVGGSGMMPLAMILAGRGARVSGSDRGLDAGRLSAKFNALAAAGIALFPQDGSGIISADQIVVASAAVEEDVADMVRAGTLGCTVLRRPELLARLFNAAVLPIGVAGTSGKSTVTGMIGWILHACGRDPTVMNGAIMRNFGGGEDTFVSAIVGSGDAFVSEVDESDGSIALYRPRIAVLNNVSLDHKPMAELNALFGGFIGHAASVVVNLDNVDAAALAITVPPTRRIGFAIERSADLSAWDVTLAPTGSSFVANWGGERVTIALGVPGRHNVSNALAALGAALAAGVPLAEAGAALAGFTGLKRRMELVGEAAGVTVIDDFGHNPDKIAATLDALHAFPGRLLILFQPHGYGPLRLMRHELVACFAQRLSPRDVLVLSDPVYQGGTVDRSAGSDTIVAPLAAAGHAASHIPDRAAAAAHLVAEARASDRIVVMGARDDTLGLLAADMLASVEARNQAV